MKRKGKSLAALLAVLLAIGLTACGQEESAEGTGSAAALESERETESVETGTAEVPETEAVENPEVQAITVPVKETRFNSDNDDNGWCEWEYDAGGNKTKETR